jgi:GNAT superfamily N-acetyltransferase
MLYRLQSTGYARAGSLFATMECHLIIRAVIAGSSPGAVYVDHPEQPSAAWVSSAEGCYLAGDPENATFVNALRDMLAVTFLAEPGSDLYLTVDSPRWERQLAFIVPHRSLFREHRRHYTCRSVLLDWRARLPDGYTMRHIDAQLLAEPGLHIPEHIQSWMAANWGSPAAFLANGLGACTLHGDQIVAWSLADCIAGDHCEIGIHTAPAYRRRGLASLTAAAMVEQCLAHGIVAVGWHCGEENTGSWKTAEKVGFVQTGTYVTHYFSAS